MTEKDIPHPASRNSQPTPSAAELRAVTRRFGGSDAPAALEDFSLEVRTGEFLTLLGPSGCGKTTALRLLSGLETPDAGQVFLDGKDVTALPPYRRAVNQVFQSYALFPHLSVAENIAFGLRMQRLPAKEVAARVAWAVELLALGGLTERRPDALSGGQRQRVALARALVCEGKVLLLDEPLSALDARLRAQVRGELRALQRRLGRTFVFVTHDQEEALALSDRVVVMRAGRLEQIGGAEEIYQRPRSRFVAQFVGEANLLAAEIIGREGGCRVCRLAGRGAEVLVRTRLNDDGESGTSSSVALLVRPESVRLRTGLPSNGQDRESVNEWAARVEDRVFHGAGTMLTVAVPLEGEGKGTPVCLRVLSVSGETFEIGAEVTMSVDPSDVIVLA